jgi:DnaJ-class molecular chaperone
MTMKRLKEHMDKNGKAYYEKIVAENTPCKECGGFGHFGNTDGSDFTECENCLGEGVIR